MLRIVLDIDDCMTDTVRLHRFIRLALKMLYRLGKYHAVDQGREMWRANAVNIMPADILAHRVIMSSAGMTSMIWKL